MRNILRFVYIPAVIIILLIVIINRSRDKLIKETIITMGTTANIDVVLKSPDRDTIKKARLALGKAERLLNGYDAAFSYYSEDSELSRINRTAAAHPVKASETLIDVLTKALRYSAITDGVFDVTAASLKKENGYSSIVLNKKKGTIYFKDARTKIDLGGILTGFAIDKVVEYFKNSGINNYLIDVGGDIYAGGLNREGNPWQIGIRNPQSQDKIIKRITISNQAITTSGNYVKKHIIDPEKKTVASGDVLSVTVIAPTCLDADVFATAFFIMGIDKTKVFIKNKGVKAIFIVNGKGQPKIISCGLEKGEG